MTDRPPPSPIAAASAAATPPDRAVTRLVTLVLGGALAGMLLGSANLLTWVEDWPPGPLTDRALPLAHAWHEAMQATGLARLHPALREAERALEAWGADPDGR